MRFSLNALKSVINFPYTAEGLAEKLTGIGLEVEEVKNIEWKIEGILTSKILKIEKQDILSNLKIAHITTSKENFKVLTAALNIFEGQIVPFAPVGATTKKIKKIEKKEFNGFLSKGMLCSYEELGLPQDLLSSREKEGILTLPEDTPLGIDIKNVFPYDDTILEVSINPDKADALSVIGLARWISIILARDNKRTNNFEDINFFIKEESLRVPENIKVSIENYNDTPGYTGLVIKNISVKDSSFNLRKELFLLGIRPINNIVDITNVSLKKLGQPLHAFDLDKIKDNKIIIRRAKEGEKIITLDEIERQLNPSNLVIANSREPIAIAGVMGGLLTSVDNSTNNIFLESANFNPPLISYTTRKLNLKTDASYIFERGVDLNISLKAAIFARDLILKETNGTFVGGIDLKEEGANSLKSVSLRTEKVKHFLGVELSNNDIENLLSFEGLKAEKMDSLLKVNVPSFRSDLQTEEDLIEEIVRMKGYNEFEESLPIQKIKRGTESEERRFIKEIKNILSGSGFFEIRTLSFVNSLLLDEVGFKDYRKILNPLSSVEDALRPSLLINLLNVTKENIEKSIKDLLLFEIGKVFSPDEKVSLAMLATGKFSKNWKKVQIDYDFYYLKGFIQNFFSNLNINEVDFINKPNPLFNSSKSAIILSEDKEMGVIGELSKEILTKLQLDSKIYYAELDFVAIKKLKKSTKMYKSISKFPSVKRDLAILLKENIEVKNIEDIIKSEGGSYLKNIEMFDYYKGSPLPSGFKNVAYSLKFVSEERTLKGEEVDEIIDCIIKSLEKNKDIKVRKQNN